MFTTLQNFNSLIDGACGVFRDALKAMKDGIERAKELGIEAIED